MRRYWLDDGLLYAGDAQTLRLPCGGGLRQELLRETHDPQRAGHPGIERMLALLTRSYYWPRTEEDVEARHIRGCG